MYQIELYFQGIWTVVATGFATRDQANWAIAQWKQDNECLGDRCFRVPEMVAKS